MDDKKAPLIVLVEEDLVLAEPLREAVAAIKGNYQLEIFSEIEGFQKWLEQPPATPDSPSPQQLKLAIFPTAPFKSVEAVQALQTKMLTAAGGPIPFLLTTFEPPPASIDKWGTSGAFNLIEKPFDRALAQEHLKLAMGLDEKADEHEVFTMKTSAIIEMLKSVPMAALSEVGFITLTDRPIEAGRITKFYGKVFAWREVLSVFGRTLNHGAGLKPPAESSLSPVAMTFFGTTRDQLLQIRGAFPKTPPLILPWRETKPDAACEFYIIGDPSPPGAELSGTLQRVFSNVKVHTSVGVPDAKAIVPANLTAVLSHINFIDTVLKDPRFKDVPKIGLAHKTPSDEEYRRLAPLVVDIVAIPVERVTFYKKIAVLFPQMKLADPMTISTHPWVENLDVGQAIEILQISEVGLALRYERELPLNTFRRFVLWIPREVGLPVLTGRVFKCEKDPANAGKFIIHFVFFGMIDHEIKHVRLWIRDNYIKAKQKGN